MSKKLVYLYGILITIILGSILYYFLNCSYCNSIGKDATEIENSNNLQEVNNATMNSFDIKDDQGDLDLNIKENLNFRMSNYLIQEPISNDVNNGVLKIKEYLGLNPLKTLGIIGFYTNKEQNNSAYPNLGLARANAVKNYLVSTGISSMQIDTNGELNDDLISDNKGVFYGPIQYVIWTNKEGDTSAMDAIKALGDTIRANPLVLYFDTGASSINLSVEQRQKIADMSRYIDKVDDASIQIIGHTDNTGARHSNIKLGQNRADFVKRYLMGNAIPESKINTSSKGPDEPIASNETDEERTKNRRVILTIN